MSGTAVLSLPPHLVNRGRPGIVEHGFSEVRIECGKASCAVAGTLDQHSLVCTRESDHFLVVSATG